MRPIVSNVGTTTYNTAKYLANLLVPLAKSDYTIINTADFINRLKKERIPGKYKMISFDVKSLFTNVALDETISIIVRKIYDEGKIETDIPRNVMKELLLLCTKHVHLTFNGDIYIQLDGVAMGSPLGPLLANVFMCSLEEAIVPTLKDCLVHWKRYVDDTHVYVEPEKIDYVMEKLNNYHQQIQFTYELEKYQRISFLDVLIRRLTNGKLETTVFRKETNTYIYMNWNSHAPIQWKIGTLKNVVKRSIIICSDQRLLQKELDNLRKVFVQINDYPSKIVKSIIKNELEKENADITNEPQTNTTDNSETKLQLFLPFSGKQGTQLLSKMKRRLKKSIPSNVKTCITCEGTKFLTQFPVKDRTKFEHRHNIVYFSRRPNVTCNETYVAETDRRIRERIIDHNEGDKSSHLLKHARKSQQTHVWKDNFKILNGNCKSSVKRKISEALYIRTLKPTLNVKEKSVRLELYN